MKITGIFIFTIILVLLRSIPGAAQFCDCGIPAAARNIRLSAVEEAVKARHLPFGLHRTPASARNERLMVQFEWVTWSDDLRMPLWVVTS